MGRVARYKKVRADPFGGSNNGEMAYMWGEGDNGRKKKKKSLTVQKIRRSKQRKGLKVSDRGFDLPPEEEDDFDLNDLIGSLKKQKPPEMNKRQSNDTLFTSSLKTTKTTTVYNIPTNIAEATKTMKNDEKELKEHKVLQKEKDQERKDKDLEIMPRMVGESKRAFQKRMASEAKRAIRNERIEENKNPERKQKKKEFLSEKKKRKKKKNRKNQFNNYDDDDDDQDNSQPRKKSRTNNSFQNRYNDDDDDDNDNDEFVTFGEQVERPPTFQQLPRGAKKKTTKIDASSSSSSMNAQKTDLERKAMERMRENVQAQYAQLKARRKKGGHF